MLRLRPIAASAAALLLLGGCQRKTAPVEAPRPFVLADAITHWYGRYDPATQTARANLPEHPSVDLTGSWFAPTDPVDIVVIFEAAYLQAGHPRHVVVTAAVPHRSDKPGRPGDDSFNCLTCRPVIGMAVFTRRLNTWLLEDANDAVDLAGGNGRSTLRQAGDSGDRPARHPAGEPHPGRRLRQQQRQPAGAMAGGCRARLQRRDCLHQPRRLRPRKPTARPLLCLAPR